MKNQIFSELYKNIGRTDRFRNLCADAGISPEILKKNHLYTCLLSDEEFSEQWKDYCTAARAAVGASRESETDIIFIKSFRNFPYIDDDLDIVINGPLEDYENALFRSGCTRLKNWASFREPLKRQYIHPEFQTIIHVHQQGSWNGIITMEREDVFKNHLTKQIEELTVKIPGNDMEFLVQAAQFLFEDYYISLGSLHYIEHLIKTGLDWDHIFRHSQERRWEKGLVLFLTFLNENYRCLGINVVLPGTEKIARPKPRTRKYPSFIGYHRLIDAYLTRLRDSLSLRKRESLLWQSFIYFLVGPTWKYLLPIYRLNKLYAKNHSDHNIRD